MDLLSRITPQLSDFYVRQTKRLSEGVHYNDIPAIAYLRYPHLFEVYIYKYQYTSFVLTFSAAFIYSRVYTLHTLHTAHTKRTAQ